MAATTCELNWTNISFTIGVVTLVVSVPFLVLLVASFALTRRQRCLILALRRQLEITSMNQATSVSQVQPPHPVVNSDQCQHSSPCISEEPVYADVQEDDIAVITEYVASEKTCGNVWRCNNN